MAACVPRTLCTTPGAAAGPAESSREPRARAHRRGPAAELGARRGDGPGLRALRPAHRWRLCIPCDARAQDGVLVRVIPRAALAP
eukprot:scaffold67372_cov62-Phaeocystis_antarctica.AAC.4